MVDVAICAENGTVNYNIMRKSAVLASWVLCQF